MRLEPQKVSWVMKKLKLCLPCCSSSGPHSSRILKAERQRVLLDQYFFRCGCEACTQQQLLDPAGCPEHHGLQCDACNSPLEVWCIIIMNSTPWETQEPCVYIIGEVGSYLGSIRNLMNSSNIYLVFPFEHFITKEPSVTLLYPQVWQLSCDEVTAQVGVSTRSIDNQPLHRLVVPTCDVTIW